MPFYLLEQSWLQVKVVEDLLSSYTSNYAVVGVMKASSKLLGPIKRHLEAG